MRPTSVIAGLLALLAALWVLAWAINPTPATQQQAQNTPTTTEEPADVQGDVNADPSETPTAEMYETNPFTLHRNGAQPKASVDKVTHEFGRLAIGASGNHDFIIRNDGEAALKLAKGKSTCKCTGFSLGTKEIAPGESAPIHLEWKPPPEAAEVFSQTATIWTNDPENPQIDLQVEGAIVPLIVLSPSGAWNVGALSEGVPTTVKGHVASNIYDSFEITSVESSSALVTATYEPLSAEALTEIDAKSGYALTCTVDSEMPVGNFLETVKLHLSLPEAPIVTFSVQGNRSGPFQIIGPGWTQSRQMLAMGRCKASDGKKVQVSLFVSLPPGATVEFGEPQVTPPILNVSVKRDESFTSSGGRQRFHILLEAPPGLTPGRWSRDSVIKVNLPCNHPSATAAVLEVEFQAD